MMLSIEDDTFGPPDQLYDSVSPNDPSQIQSLDTSKP